MALIRVQTIFLLTGWRNLYRVACPILTPCPIFEILELSTKTEFVDAVGMLRKKLDHQSKAETISKLTDSSFTNVAKLFFMCKNYI